MKPRFRLAIWCTGAALAALAGPLFASGFNASAALRASQDALGRQVRDVAFVDQHGAGLRLASLRGHPVVISMIYTSCSSICPTTTQQLAAGVQIARGALGPTGFTVLSVGFDTAHDTPQALQAFATERHVNDPHWYFVTATPAAIRQLATEIGFWYAPSGGMYEHLVQTTILDARGRVVRQIYGNEFSPLQLSDPLKRSALGAPLGDAPVLSFIERIRLLCTVYDVRLGRYRFDYSMALSILVAVSTALVVVVLVARAWHSGAARGRV
jgi:protein SCO1